MTPLLPDRAQSGVGECLPNRQPVGGSALMVPRRILLLVLGASLLAVAVEAHPQQPPNAQSGITFIQQGQQLIREGSLPDALSLYRTVLKTLPNSLPAHDAAGTVLDLMGKGEEARTHFQKALDLAANEQERANAARAMAMSWAFSGNCDQTVTYQQKALGYYIARKDFYQQSELAGEAARVCLDNGALDTAFQWYLTAHDLGLKQPEIPATRKNVLEFRWESAQARVAARKGNQTEADRHVAAAMAMLEKDEALARTETMSARALEGYVALYEGYYDAALAQLGKANPDDASIQYLMGESCERLGQQKIALERFTRAAAATAHDASVAYARPGAIRKLAAGKGQGRTVGYRASDAGRGGHHAA